MIGPAISPRPLSGQPDGEPQLRVLVADPDGLARSMLRAALSELDRVASVAVAGDRRDALQQVAYLQPAVIVLDTTLMTKPGTDLITAILTASPHTRILTIAVDDQPNALAALKTGAIGHLGKQLDPDQLANLILQAADGHAVIPQELMLPLLELLRQVPDTGWRPLHSRLTTREWQIVEQLAKHATTEQIAENLVLSVTTVYSHVKSVLRKLDVHTRRDAIQAAERLRREESLGRNTPFDLGAISPPGELTEGKFGGGRTTPRGAISIAPQTIHKTPLLRGKETRHA
jgi:DNA-binding NarL/FixJ family response regulator